MSKKITVWLLVLSMFCLLAGCQGKEEETREYINKGNTFSVTVPGEWKITETDNEDHLVLDNEDQSLSILIQRFPQEGLEEEDGSGLEDFMAAYKSQVIPDLAAAGSESDGDAQREGMKQAREEEYKMTQSGQVFKAYILYVESDVAYYSVAVTGTGESYDPDIDKLKTAVKTLKEL